MDPEGSRIGAAAALTPRAPPFDGVGAPVEAVDRGAVEGLDAVTVVVVGAMTGELDAVVGLVGVAAGGGLGTGAGGAPVGPAGRRRVQPGSIQCGSVRAVPSGWDRPSLSW
jgi:hypothetical protein